MILAVLGNLSLICSFISTISTIYFSFWTHKKEFYNYYLLLILANLQFIFCFSALAILCYGYTISDFTILNVYKNSSSNLPLIFKIASLWGNHEGSMLLWTFLLIFNTIIFAFTSNAPIPYKSFTLLVQSLINACFLSFIIFTSNPFEINKILATEGIGFNPLLQDQTLIIHPPILYLSYSASSIIFSLAVAGCLTKAQAKLIAFITQRWILFTFITLTAGITLGSWWAYRELGWGGFWFWDPVENSSLMPWLLSLGLIHVVKITTKNNKFYNWYLGFSLSLFCSTIIATFIVRSGIISSVHSFANDNSRGIYILIFLGLLLLLSIIIMLTKTPSKSEFVVSAPKELGFLLLFSIVTTLFLTILLTLTLPLLIDCFLNYKITIGEPYFNKTFIPIAILGLCCAAIFSSILWKGSKKSNYKNLIISITCAFLATTYLKYFYELQEFKNLIYLFIILFLISSTTLTFFVKTNYQNLPMMGAHIGIAIMAFGICLTTTLSNELTKKLVVGENFIYKDYSFTLNEIKLTKKDNFIAISTPLYIEKFTNEVGILSPEIRFFQIENTSTTESAIHSSLFEDLYITIHEIIDQQNVVIKIYLKPFMVFIWLGVIMIVSFSLLALFRRKYV